MYVRMQRGEARSCVVVPLLQRSEWSRHCSRRFEVVDRARSDNHVLDLRSMKIGVRPILHVHVSANTLTTGIVLHRAVTLLDV